MSLYSCNVMVLIAVTWLIIGAWLWRYYIKPFFAKNKLRKQLERDPHFKALLETHKFLQDLFHHINGAHISQSERKRLSIEDDAFIYGEINFLSFYAILEKVKPQSQEIFYDLGSGVGKAVFAAASFFPLRKAYGIELLPGLYDAATMLITKAKTLTSSSMQKVKKIEFIQKNFLDVDISQGDIVFINATCLSYVVWEKIIEKLLLLKKGSRVIVTSKKIEHRAFNIVSQTFELMSWGVNSVNIYLKVE